MARHSSESRRSGKGVAWRAIQFCLALVCRHDPAVDRRLRSVLQNDAQWRLLQRLSAFDRAHHLRVHDTLVDAGYVDLDLLLAAALHDVGKADDFGRVWLAHRVLKVLLQTFAPGTVDRQDGRWLGHGLFLAQQHARLGSELALAAGVSERCAKLIARHEEHLPVDDPELYVLIQADAGAIA